MLNLEGVCIESTMKYDRFTNIVGNREISTDNVKRLVASMGDKHLASIAIVNGKDEIIDGAHRYRAAKELGLPFNFIVMRKYGIEEVHRLNSNMKNWSNEDYVHQFSDRYENGEHIFINYFRLTEFMKSHTLPLNKALLLLESGVKSGSIPLRAGTFKIYEDKEKASENLSNLMELEKELGSKIMTQSFWQTYILMTQLEGFDEARFLNKAKRSIGDLTSTKDTVKHLSAAFEEVYNHSYSESKELNIAFAVRQLAAKLKKSRHVEDEDDGK